MRRRVSLETVVGLIMSLFIAICLIFIAYGNRINNQIKADILQNIQNRGTYTITINSWIASDDIVKRTIKEYNKKASKEDIYSIYQVEENIYWVVGEDGYIKELARFRLNLVDGSFLIERKQIPKAIIKVNYATEEQQKECQESILFWESFIKTKADITVEEERKGEITQITVILTPKDFANGGEQMHPLLILYSKKPSKQSCNIVRNVL